MIWFLALCGFSAALGAFIECEKVNKENKNLRARIQKLEKEVYK
ncbi:hypothetical protein [Halobacillus hunanensis]|nr:hypothetical protein [Halobacillus hunanensis]